MASVRNLIVIIGVLNILKRVSGDYPCICNYHVELTVTNSPDDKGTLIGYMYEFDCKPQAFVKDLDSKWLAVAFEKKLGYVQKDEQVQIQKCPGNQPEEDKLPTSTTLTTTPFTTMTQSTVTTPYTTTTQLTTTPATTKIESTVISIPSTNTTQSTEHITTSTQSTVPATQSATKTQRTVIITQSTVPTTTPNTTTIPTVTTTQSKTTKQTTLPITASITTKTQSIVPSTSSTTTIVTIKSTEPTTQITTTKQSTLTTTTTTTVTTATQQPNNSVQAPHVFVKVSLLTSQCQNGAFQFGHFCYKLVANANYWDLAELNCTVSGGHLLSITNANEEEYIYQLLKELNISEPIWTGLNDKIQEGMFQWSSGDLNFYNNVLTWSQGMKEPQNSDEDCVVVETRNYPLTMDDINCASRHAYICKYQVNTQSQTSEASSTVKPAQSGQSNRPDFFNPCLRENRHHVQEFKDLCFEYVENADTWSNAKSSCVLRGGTLVELHTPEEHTNFETFLTQNDNKNQIWTGLLHPLMASMTSKLQWVSGQTLDNEVVNIDMHAVNTISHSTDICFTAQNNNWIPGHCYDIHPYVCMYRIRQQPGSLLIG